MNDQQIDKNCLILFIIKEIEIKGTMRHHFTPVRVDIIKKYTSGGEN